MGMGSARANECLGDSEWNLPSSIPIRALTWSMTLNQFYRGQPALRTDFVQFAVQWD